MSETSSTNLVLKAQGWASQSVFWTTQNDYGLRHSIVTVKPHRLPGLGRIIIVIMIIIIIIMIIIISII